jgi:hypothetical protein
MLRDKLWARRGEPLLRERIGVAVGCWGHIWEFYWHGGGPGAYSGGGLSICYGLVMAVEEL